MRTLGTATVLHGNALDLPLDDNTVDLVVTSPPYFGLRSYQDAGAHYDGQLGSEATPAEFVDALIAATREMMRVVKPSGSIFVNLGDKYAGSDGTSGGPGSTLGGGAANGRIRGTKTTSKRGTGNRASGAPAKSLIGIPWRYALRCIDDLGLILRAEIIWSKPNGLPESVTDRVRRSHEQWFHFTLQPRYYSAVDEIREPSAPPSSTALRGPTFGFKSNGDRGDLGAGNFLGNPLGKLPGSVWTIPTQPLSVPPGLGVDHFAAFPMEWPRRIITGWSPREVCTACGEGRRPVTTKTAYGEPLKRNLRHIPGYDHPAGQGQRDVVTTVTGYDCDCMHPRLGPGFDPGWTPPPTTPGAVLDPFGGTGTTALIAKALGRTGISVDLSTDYCRLARWRTTDPAQLAAALQVEKPAPVDPDQLDLFGEAIA